MIWIFDCIINIQVHTTRFCLFLFFINPSINFVLWHQQSVSVINIICYSAILWSWLARLIHCHILQKKTLCSKRIRWSVCNLYHRCCKPLMVSFRHLLFNTLVLKVYIAPYQCFTLQQIPPKCCLVYPEGGAMLRNHGMLRKTILNEPQSHVNTPPRITTKICERKQGLTGWLLFPIILSRSAWSEKILIAYFQSCD